MHWIYLIHEFRNLSWITEINELFHDILIYWDAPVCAWFIDQFIMDKGKKRSLGFLLTLEEFLNERTEHQLPVTYTNGLNNKDHLFLC